jgi:hypothetical protein
MIPVNFYGTYYAIYGDKIHDLMTATKCHLQTSYDYF